MLFELGYGSIAFFLRQDRQKWRFFIGNFKCS